MMRTCTVSGCEGKHYGKQLCSLHYKRMTKTGTTSGPTRRERGTGTIKQGYLRRSVDGQLKYAHIDIAEKILGRPLPAGVIVHHVDKNRANNSPDNLVICPDRAYHNLIHARMRAMDACGNPNWRKCTYCKVYDSPVNVKEDKDGKRYHLTCRSAYYVVKYQRHRARRESLRG